MRILAVGDVCGSGGLDILERKLRGLQRLEQVDFTIVNGEMPPCGGLRPSRPRPFWMPGRM